MDSAVRDDFAVGGLLQMGAKRLRRESRTDAIVVLPLAGASLGTNRFGRLF